MKKYLFMLLIGLSATATTALAAGPHQAMAHRRSSELWGEWSFLKAVRAGHEIFPPGMAEHIEFIFDQEGYNSLIYRDEMGRVLCQRRARYDWNGEKLMQRITWVSPGNDPSCSSDPDMQLGKTAINTAYIKNNDLYINILLSDETLSYIWKRKVKN